MASPHRVTAFAIHGQERLPVGMLLDDGSPSTFVHPGLLEILTECETLSSPGAKHRDNLPEMFRITLQSVHDSSRVDI